MQPMGPGGSQADDLTQIEGVGPKIAELFKSQGIDTYSDLASKTPDQLRELLGAEFAAHDPSTWPDQAAMASSGDWEGLRAWQDQLEGGREIGGAGAAPAMGGGPIGGAPGGNPIGGPIGGDTMGSNPVGSDPMGGNPIGGNPMGGGMGGGAIGDPGAMGFASGDMVTPAVPPTDAQPGFVSPQMDDATPLVESVVPEAAGDDLTLIEGIGPKIAETLNAGGVSTFAQLGAMSPGDVSNSLGSTFASHDPTTWPKQAQMAAAGQWDELKVWQDQLDGGREVQASDDLTLIEGIGPKGQELLNNAGITTLAQLATTDAETIRGWLAADGMGAHDPTTWPKQAELAAAGKMDELKAWQDELDGGKIVAAKTPDDLTIVEGIGPKGQEILNNAGITTFAELAKTEATKIAELLAADGMSAHDPTTWPAQAQMAAEGRMEELKKWQDELDGGRA